MGFRQKFILLVFILSPFLSLQISFSQPTPTAPSPASDTCNGVFLSYIYTSGERLPPLNSSNQAYKFQSTATILNNGVDDLNGWKFFVGFQHEEILVSAGGSVVLADGTSLPAKVGNGTVFAGFPSTNLKSAIDTAGDLSQMEVQIQLVGTQFGVKPPSIPMPSNISLVNDGYSCPKPTMQGKNQMQVCCIKDPNFVVNTTEVEFLPRQKGDITISYDVTRTYYTYYWAQVTMALHNPLGRLDNWKLSWDWMREEFIVSMKGAYPSTVDSTDCIYGPQGVYYQELDFSNVLNCQKRPTIIDLPLTLTNDSILGMIPFCCRNGTILPPEMNPSQSKSVFQIQVQKMPPDLNRTQLIPPQNWKISGITMNPDYQCGPPIRVSPSQFPQQNGLSVNTTAVASWQVVCNITKPKGSTPKCCVSFSAYYNDSAIPCKTCACGCQKSPSSTCSATAPAMILPPDALLVPYANRTGKAKAWAEIKHRSVPDPLPCPDNCGVSINWHVYTDYTQGWTGRVTLFNWGETNFADWFAAMEFKNAAPGFQAMYSFNGTVLNSTANNNTIFMQGLPGLNYLVAEQPGDDPSKDLSVPGKQQSVISFTKKMTPGIDIAGGDGFPTKVFFNGEECSLPSILPTGVGNRISSTSSIWVFVCGVLAFILMQQ